MNKPYQETQLAGEAFYLLPQKAMYRPLKKQLILSDVHLGKASHFRKQGIPVPPQSHLKDIDKLNFLLSTWEPLSVLILGDLFHSSYNNEWLWFKALLNEHPRVQFILVEGNHDILHNELYTLPNLLKVKQLEEENIIFSHHQLQTAKKLNISGHIHPGLQLVGKARQSMKLPCFYHSNNHFVLPAFGNLTGLCLLEREEDSDYYLIVESGIVRL